MAAVKSGDFVSNQNKYFDMAVNEDVCVKSGKNMFTVGVVNEYKPDMIFEPDDDFYRSISGEELKKRAIEMVEKEHNIFYKNNFNLQKINNK
jgi:hypothetical protein